MCRCLIALAAALVLAAPAQARPDLVVPSLAQAGPVLSGGDGTVSWVTGRGQGPLTVTTVPAGGRQPAPVAELPQTDRAYLDMSFVEHRLALDGDPDGRIAVHQLTREYFTERGGIERTAGEVLVAGPAGGPLRRISGCMSGEGYCLPRECTYGVGALAPGGGTVSLVAGPGVTCLGAPAALVGRAADGSQRYSVRVDTSLGAVMATAGRYVVTREVAPPLRAVCAQERLVLRGIDDGRPLLVTAPPSGSCLGPFDVAGDGAVSRIVFDDETSFEARRLDRVRAGRPRPQVLHRRVAPASPVAAAGRRVVVETLRSDGSALTLIGPDGFRRTLARFNDAWRRIGDIDFDGRRVAWTERRCGAPRVVVTIPALPRADPPARCGAR